MKIAHSAIQCTCSSLAETEQARMLFQMAAYPATHLAADAQDSRRGDIRKVRNTPLAIPRWAHSSCRQGARFRLRSAHPLLRRVFLLTLPERRFRPRQSSSWPEWSAHSHLIAV